LVACEQKQAQTILQSIFAAGYPAARVIGYAEAGEPAVEVITQ
jgi:selenide, water dikinase